MIIVLIDAVVAEAAAAVVEGFLTIVTGEWEMGITDDDPFVTITKSLVIAEMETNAISFIRGKGALQGRLSSF